MPNDSNIHPIPLAPEVAMTDEQFQHYAQEVADGLSQIIDDQRLQVTVYVNQHLTMIHWRTRAYLRQALDRPWTDRYGKKIVSTVLRQ